MSDETIRWKLFPFSLRGRARHWYDINIRSMEGDWKLLSLSFCQDFFPIYKVVDLRTKILTFRQGDEESLVEAWECFTYLLISGPDLALQDHVFLQHFFIGLTKKTLNSSLI